MGKYKWMAVAAAAMLAAAPAAYGQGTVDKIGSNLGLDEDGGGPGCGLGTMIHKGKSGLAAQLSAVTTNGTFSQPSAITSGTSGCTSDGMVMRQYERNMFAASNLRNLKQDVARGEGEFISSLASLMGVQAQDQAVFGAFVRDHSSQLLSDAVASPQQFLSVLDGELTTHPQLAQYVPASH